jgi:hypothetical protein
MRHINLKNLRVGGLLAMSAVAAAAFIDIDHAAQAKGATLVVAVDRNAYVASEMGLLAEQVREATHSEPERADVGTSRTGVDAVIYDLRQDSRYVDAIEKYAAGKHLSIRKSPSWSIRISFSAQRLAAYSRSRISRESDRLDSFVKGLRTLPGDVRVDQMPPGAIVRSDDPSYGDQISRELGTIVVVSPAGKNAWHVELSPKILADLSPTQALTERRSIELVLRDFLGKPDIRTSLTGRGIVVTLLDRDRDFVDVIKRAFEGNVDFVVTMSPAMLVQVAVTDAEPSEKHPGRPGDAVFQVLDDIHELTDPSVDAAVTGDVVLFRAKNPVDNDDRAAVVRRALANRSDLVITSQPDNSLQIRLAPGAHLGSPPRPLNPGDLEAAVQTRAKGLHLSSVRVTTVDKESVSVQFETGADATTFRNDLSDRFGFSIRLVDDSDPKGAGNGPPSSDDLRMPMAKGGFVWVKPAAIVTGSMISDAKVVDDRQTGGPAVEFQLNEEGRARFAEATLENVGKRIAIVTNGVVQTAPVVMSPIEGGEGQFTGGYSHDEAEEIARTLLTYKEDVPLKVVEQRPAN